ncbi:GNAT family N-acetyltransferase [Halobacillus shinanisalinarum]|uniref:GNAT family N-acetyltransferase n=1 Tax=Halobacillus shinanisalinarum TaxID=2932258 RepID=A0ABY4GVL5_9BACI|nr:GNAT family N-acetyltransferase [Halobacillus shinanisalinarum]UOQ92188.1 GNAT family N-acetyltransferase [Halobacillus shinanisalinarum]
MRKNEIINENSNINISTMRILMRQLAVEDITEFYEIVKKNSVGQWLGIGNGMTFEESEQYVNKILKHWNQHSFGVWAVVNNSTKEIMGHCGLRYIDDTKDIEIIYLLDPKFWGMGYATEAGNAAIKFAFNSLKINKLAARVRTNNFKSKKVLVKLGFQFIYDKDYDGRKLSYYELLNQNS